MYKTMNHPRNYFFVSVFGLLILSSCGNVSREVETKINELENRTKALDSFINKEAEKVLTLDSLLNKEQDKIKKLDTLIDKSSSRFDSIKKRTGNLLENTLK